METYSCRLCENLETPTFHQKIDGFDGSCARRFETMPCSNHCFMLIYAQIITYIHRIPLSNCLAWEYHNTYHYCRYPYLLGWNLVLRLLPLKDMNWTFIAYLKYYENGTYIYVNSSYQANWAFDILANCRCSAGQEVWHVISSANQYPSIVLYPSRLGQENAIIPPSERKIIYTCIHKYIAPGLGVSDNTHRTPVVDRSRHKDVHHRNPRCCEDDRAYDGEDLLLEAAELADIFQEIV